MIATVRCYYNTGLTPTNCLDSSSLLDSLGFSYKDFPDIAIKQDRGIINIKINTNYDDIKNADYCKINNNCYWITNIVMLNDNVAEVKLKQDCLTTVGIYPLFKIGIISGWCTRRHVLEDNLYENILDEPFVPTNELEIDKGTVISGSDDTGFYHIALSSVDLLNITETASKYLDDEGDKVLVPELPNVIGQNTTYTSHLVTPQKTAYIALSNAYNLENSNVQLGVKNVRQLGVESCIGACYMLPKTWASITDNNGLITSITDKSRNETSVLSQTWGNYKNKKVYSGQFQKILVFSLASGDSCENRVEDIINPETKQIVWATYADTRYSGKPGCKPAYFKGEANTALIQAIHGSNWQQTPFAYNMSSGLIHSTVAADIQQRKNKLNMDNAALNSILSLATGGFSSASNALYTMQESPEFGMHYGISALGNIAQPLMNFAQASGNYLIREKSIFSDYNSSALSYDLKFPQEPNMADYVGNAFYDLRYRLSDNDMTRFDNFLTAYGYAVDEPLKSECFTGRQNFNYVQARDVSMTISDTPQYLISGIVNQIEAGVRIWHTAPSASALIDNPIV